jgi:hypothetical protein
MPVDESSDHQVTSPVMCPTATPFRTVVVQAVPHEGSGRVVSGVVSETAKLLSVPASDADPQAETYSAAHLALDRCRGTHGQPENDKGGLVMPSVGFARFLARARPSTTNASA